MEDFDIDKACAMYFEQHARNEKAIADLRKAHKSDKENLKDEIENGFRNPFAYALGEINNKDAPRHFRPKLKGGSKSDSLHDSDAILHSVSRADLQSV